MHRFLSFVAAALVGLTAGWFLRGGPQAPPEKKSRIAAAAVADPVKAPPGASPAGLAAGWTSTGGKAGPEPFTSLEELITLFDGFNMADDQLGYIELLTALPRLLCTDLPATRRLLAELETSARPQGQEAKGMLAMSLLARWMMQEPEGAIEFGKSHPGVFGSSPDMDMIESFSMMGVMMMAKTNPASAHNLVEMLPEDEREDALEMLKMIEATHDPESALNALPPDKREDAKSILGHWARRDPEAAMRWVSARPDDEKEKLLPVVAASWARKDWKGAVQWASALPQGSGRSVVYSEIAKSVPNGVTFETADTMLAGLPQPLVDRVLLSLEHGVPNGESHLASAARVVEILKRNAADEDLQLQGAQVAQNTARALAANGEGKAAAEWVQALPSGHARESAVEALSAEWAERDAAAASEWVATLPAGEMREKATSHLIEKITDSDPERALAWAKALTNQEERTAHIGKVIRQWLPEDPFAAMRAIESLPEDLRAEIWAGEE